LTYFSIEGDGNAGLAFFVWLVVNLSR
jgi:hypothetical protein